MNLLICCLRGVPAIFWVFFSYFMRFSSLIFQYTRVFIYIFFNTYSQFQPLVMCLGCFCYVWINVTIIRNFHKLLIKKFSSYDSDKTKNATESADIYLNSLKNLLGNYPFIFRLIFFNMIKIENVNFFRKIFDFFLKGNLRKSKT